MVKLREANQELYVYVASDGPQRTKVGLSNNPDIRVRGIGYSSGRTPRLHSAFRMAAGLGRQVEEAAHQRLAAHKLEGEWFAVSDEVAAEEVRQAVAEIDGLYLSASVLRNARQKAGWTAQRWADQSGVSQATVVKALRNDQHWPAVSVSSMRALRSSLEATGIRFTDEGCVWPPAAKSA